MTVQEWTVPTSALDSYGVRRMIHQANHLSIHCDSLFYGCLFFGMKQLWMRQDRDSEQYVTTSLRFRMKKR